MSLLLLILEVAPQLLVRKWSFKKNINAQAVPVCSSDTIPAGTEAAPWLKSTWDPALLPCFEVEEPGSLLWSNGETPAGR